MQKRILYINQYFKHPGEPGSTRSYWVARQLIAAGYQVTMIAQRNLAHGNIKEAPWFEEQMIEGIRVLYLRNRYANSMGLSRRLWSFFIFMVRATWRALREKSVDLVIATSTPPTVAVPALVRKWLRGTPFLFEVRDLWPEVPIQMGVVRHPVVVRTLRWFERTTYRNAAHVIALSPGMREGVAQYIPLERTSMIPNMAKVDQFWPRERNYEMIRAMGLVPEHFRVIYFGQMGVSNAIPLIIDAATVLQNLDPEIDFIFVGHGMMKRWVEKRVQTEKLRNIIVFDRVAMREMSEIVNFCDISLVTFSNIPILRTNSPNKLFDSLSAGKPVIVNSAGWTKDLVEAHSCGLFIPPDRPGELAQLILKLKRDPVLVERMGMHARRLAEKRYDKTILCSQFLDVVDGLFQRHKRDGEFA